MKIFGTAEGRDAERGTQVSTGLLDGTVTTMVGTSDARVRVIMQPTGEYEIEVVNMFGDRVGDLGPMTGGKRRRVLKAKLPS